MVMQDEKVLYSSNVAVVIPCYKVKSHIVSVVTSLPKWISLIIVVDDCCPEGTGDFVKEKITDNRIVVVKNDVNLGVGGSVINGYKVALERNSRVVVKIDGDDQMDPLNISRLISPILDGIADYTKGNRFHNMEHLRAMPYVRLIGNAGLSFFSKISTGYWSLFDPNNGFTAISREMISNLSLEKIDKRYFFESDMLFRLNLARAVVIDIPMHAIYGDEKSNLSPVRSLFEFAHKHMKNFLKRIFYNYFLREFSLATLNLVFGVTLLLFGIVYGLTKWLNSMSSGIPTNTGALIIVSMSILSGLQMLLSFVSYDMSHEPKNSIGKLY